MGLKAMKVTPMTARLLLRNDRGLPKSAVIAMLGLLYLKDKEGSVFRG